MSNLLDVQDLTIDYPAGGGAMWGGKRFVAVREASFSIGQGETFGLVGESGSGKTTIGRAILRLEKAAAGQIFFEGRSVTDFGRTTPLSYRRDVQIVFQDPSSSLNPRHRVGKILDQVIARHEPRPAKDRVRLRDELLEKVQLAPYHATRFPAELSGGQKQRVAIAHALASKPRLVVCDEAVSALDVSTQGQILNLLRELQDKLGISYLFISHDLSVVRHMSRRIAVMYLGRIVETGDANAVYTDPQHPYTKMLLASVLLPHPGERDRKRQERLQLRAQANASTGSLSATGCPFRSRCPSAHSRCAETMPPMVAVGTQRKVACHLYS
ncbi:ABC transporter ATP-binding protein [Mesorhizobium microcysteis]|uniref:ABC transporter ATP-binding protein n=1 Tax=Neoaquamicrobium microcysteis TaxID=2682781 RepID=A0A5D4H776_9HYPH|nr:ABC transporter ATP-binding protein [Mesorhizobium microcysteis]TYR36384.1 ABC transporter ATP-binding protein [Mesorhizobium microcysteis]